METAATAPRYSPPSDARLADYFARAGLVRNHGGLSVIVVNETTTDRSGYGPRDMPWAGTLPGGPGEEFDAISFGTSLAAYPDPEAAVRIALSWLRPGGALHAEVPKAFGRKRLASLGSRGDTDVHERRGQLTVWVRKPADDMLSRLLGRPR